MSDPLILEQTNGSKGRFVLTTPEGEAELTFSILSDALRIADHTAVPKALEGNGYAFKLVLHLIEDAKSKGYKIVPLCPYVNAQRDKHPEWAEYFSI